ncbi:MAG: PD40 domain-containing protein [Acidobacteria bacterium]|nr:PD40 domain-containing protein [Acidobacteriota bacterium]
MELRKRGIRIKLAARPFRVLLLLLARPGQVVERDEIRKQLWGEDTFVDFDRNLNLCISQIRTALSDDASVPAYIETVPRMGYRFIGGIEASQPAAADPIPQPVPARNRLRTPLAVAAVLSLLLLLGATWLFLGQRVVQPPLRIKPLTGYGGQVSSPSFSPDGERVAFSWRPKPGGPSHIEVKLVDTGEPLVLTAGPDRDHSPVWSPDGRNIAFVREDSTTRAVWTTPALGGVPQRAYTFNQRLIFHWLGQPMSWLENGDLLVSDREVQGGDTGPILPLRIYRVRDGNRVAALTNPPRHWWGDVAPSVSPDGKWVAFLRGASFSMASLYLQQIDGAPGSERPLLEGAMNLSGVGWSPDSRTICFGAELEQGTGIWRVALDGGSPIQVTATARLPLGVTVSPQKSRAAFTNMDARDELWTMPITASPDSSSSWPSSAGHGLQARISPNGRTVVFASNRSGSMELWSAARDGTGLVQLTRSSAQPNSPAWSPAGDRIAFAALVNNDSEIFVIPAGGGRPLRLTQSPGLDARPAWSADGQWIYFSSKRSGLMDIWKIPATGAGEAVRVTYHGGHQPLEWKGHVYYRPDMIRPGIKRVPIAGGEEIAIWNEPFSDWTPGKDGIHLLSRGVLGSLHPDRNRWTPLVTFHGIEVSGFALSPEEREVVYTKVSDRSSQIMVIENLRLTLR